MSKIPSMFQVFGEVKKHIPTSGKRKPKINSAVFQTMKLTMLATIMACVLVTAKQYIGENITCITNLEKQEHKAVENYCFISGTFTLPKLPEEESVHPGVGPSKVGGGQRPGLSEPPSERTGDSEGGEDVQIHAYYQWVPIVLALQSALYFLPALLWKQIDKGFFETILCGLNTVYMDESEATKHIRSSAHYLSKTLTQHKRFVFSFLAVEVFCFFLAVLNLFLTNIFLGGEFFRFGTSAVKYLNAPAYDFNNPLNEVFPKVAKCTWFKYGPTGDIQKHDAMCVLPLNIVNEKTYIFLWIVYIITAVVTGAFLLFHILLFAVSGLRNRFLLRLPMKPVTKTRVDHILRKGDVGDWFLIWNYKHHMVYFEEWAKALEEYINQ